MKNRLLKTETCVHYNAVASTALTTLKGLIEGVICDQILNDLERTRVLDWVDKYSFMKNHPAIGSVFDYLAEALVDGVLTLEESNDIRWMIEKNLSCFYDESTQQIQSLHGLLSGIAADKEISAAELTYLWSWLNDNEHLKGLFPFDEIYSLICQVGTKKALTSDQKTFLLNVFEWTENKTLSAENPFVPWAVDPSIEFCDKSFCITGISKKMPRQKITDIIESNAGRVVRGVSSKLDYLVVCAEVNIAWTHACYGRKVEHAIKLRREGKKLAIVTEIDFWDALVE